MDAMPMHGAPPMSMPSFLGMWSVMVAAMMTPSLIPALRRYRDAVRGAGERRVGLSVAVASVGYFFVWSALGPLAFPVDALRERLTPAMVALLLSIAGAFQLTAWRRRHLTACRRTPEDTRGALRYGLCLGIHCVCSCAGWTMIALLLGVMDLRVMAVATAVITLERSHRFHGGLGHAI